MTQKFYLRDLPAVYAPTTGEKSTVEPVAVLQAENATGTDETRSLRENKGFVQAQITRNTDASSAARNGYHARFTSERLKAGTYGSGTITYAMAIVESNGASNFFQAASIYFWRPSNNTVVGFVYDSDTTIGTEAATSETGEVNDITGSNVTILDGDVLVLEFWRKQSQNNAAGRTNTIWFDGSTEPIDGTAISNAAAYINMPANIPLLENFALIPIPQTGYMI